MNQLMNTDLATIERNIKALKGKTAETMLAIGDELIKAKSLLRNGEWAAWLENNVEISDRTARQLMQAAQAFPIEKRQTLANLDVSKIYLLASATEEQQAAILESGDAERMTTRQLKEAMKPCKREPGHVYIRLDKLKEIHAPTNPAHPILAEIGYPNIIGETDATFYELCALMESDGQFQAITITEDGTILDGYRRVNAARLLGWDTIKARIEPIQSTDEYKCLEYYYKRNMLTHTRWAAFYLYKGLYELHTGDIEAGEASIAEYLQSNKDAETEAFINDAMQRAGLNATLNDFCKTNELITKTAKEDISRYVKSGDIKGLKELHSLLLEYAQDVAEAVIAAECKTGELLKGANT